MEFDSPLASILMYAMVQDHTIIEFRVDGEGDDATMTALDITDHVNELESLVGEPEEAADGAA